MISATLSVLLGQTPVTVSTLTVVDESRNRSIPVLVRSIPRRAPAPLVVFSHGGLADEFVFPDFGNRLARAGFIVLYPRHADSRLNSNSGGLFGMNNNLNRVRDVSAMLDRLAQVEQAVPHLRGMIDRERIGVAGHSYGAYVAQVIGGARVLVSGRYTSLQDKRVDAVMPISAQGIDANYGLGADSWRELRLPLFTITGTLDSGAAQFNDPNFNLLEYKGACFFRSVPGDKFMMVITGARHTSFGNPAGGTATQLTSEYGEIFFRAYLMNDTRSAKLLETVPAQTQQFTFNRR